MYDSIKFKPENYTKEVKMKCENIRAPIDNDDRVYPCSMCGKLRSKNEGGTIFTVCDDCWELIYGGKDEVRKMQSNNGIANHDRR